MITIFYRLALTVAAIAMLVGCGTREVQDSLAGATAQQLVAHSIDDLARSLPASDFTAHSGKRVYIESHFFLEDNAMKRYADQRLASELERRFDMTLVREALAAEVELAVFYTALGTDHSQKGFFVPLGFMPGLDESTEVNLITLEQFHGVAEMYYFIGPSGIERRGAVLQARTRTDAIGLPIITIPISDIDRQGEGGEGD